MTTLRLLQSSKVLAAVILATSAYVLPAAAADGLIGTHRISAALALEAVSAAMAACAAQGFGETVVLVDADGVRQAEVRGDGTGVHTLDAGFDKAYTSATYKGDTLALAVRAASQPSPSALQTGLAKLPHLLPAGGGVVIKVGDEVVGAISASGTPSGEVDEGCAKAGLAKISDRLK